MIRPQTNLNEIYFQLEHAITLGLPMLLENVEETLDPIFDDVNLLQKVLFNLQVTIHGRRMIRLGEKLLEYHPDFRFYITSKHANPHYQPEICIKVIYL